MDKPEVLTKHCTQCNLQVPKVNFYRMANAPDGLAYKCKPCQNQINKERVKRNKGEYQARKRVNGGFINGTIVPALYPKIMDQPETIRKVVIAWMENPTARKEEIAQITGLKLNQLNWACYHNPYLKAFRSLAQKSIKNLIPLAVHGLKECLTSENEKVKLTAALELLKSEKILGSERIEVTVEDSRSRSVEDVRKLIQEAKLIPQPTISDSELIGNPDA